MSFEPPSSTYYGEQMQQTSITSPHPQAVHAREQSPAQRRLEMAASAEAQERVRARELNIGAYDRSLASGDDEMRQVSFDQERFQSPGLQRGQGDVKKIRVGKPEAEQPSESLNDALDALCDRNFLPYQRLAAKPEVALYAGEGEGFEGSSASVTGSARGESEGKSSYYDADRDANRQSMNERGGAKHSEPASQYVTHVGSGLSVISPIIAGPFSSGRLPQGADGSPLKKARLKFESNDTPRLGRSEGHLSQPEHLKLDGIQIDEF